MRTMRRRTAVATVLGAALVAVAACGSDTTPESPNDDGSPEEVTIAIGDLPSAQSESRRLAFLAAVEQFQLDNPHITLEPTETRFDSQTFAALLAGGTMPTVMGVPFTNTQLSISSGQVADITEPATDLGLQELLNPDTLAQAQDDAGNIFGIPTSVSALGLLYNRALFEEAGLDPDQPPQTWDEVREAARTITEQTGEPGYLQITEAQGGGWIFSSQLYSFGGMVQDPAGEEVQLDSPETIAALEALSGMFWDDQTMGQRVVYNIDDILQEFAAGRVGMFVSPVNAYEWINNTYAMDLNSIGAAGMPQADGGPHGTLLGGTVQMFNPRATPAELQAAVAWVDYFYLQNLTDPDRAASDAEALAADGGVVGLPLLSPLAGDALEDYRSWIEPHVNVPVEHFAAYDESLSVIPLIPEPTRRAQETYAELAPMLQAVLTERDADIPALVAEAVTRIDRVMSQ